MKQRYEIQEDKGLEGGKWTGEVVYTIYDRVGVGAPKEVLTHHSAQAAQQHCNRLNDEHAASLDVNS
ncbi:hypothetical protein ACI77F_00025 [Pseudomonas tritici]|uniref:hypothetical protein n=1 Tax=Pseudomonas tritici TaxID=2745518 RepID=UPI00387AB393